MAEMKKITRTLYMLAAFFSVCRSQCQQDSITEVAGSSAPQEFCAGDLIFSDEFDDLQTNVWEHILWQPGTVNNEFQEYVDDRKNSWVIDSVLHISATADENAQNHIHSARLHSTNAFAFKYGRLEIRAKTPTGDWLWPALWTFPKDNTYGDWPASGEIDVMESRGNKELMQGDHNIGVEFMESTMHFGPDPAHNGMAHAHFSRNTEPGQGWNLDFHRYQLEWTNDYVKFLIDDNELGTVTPGDGGFYELGQFQDVSNPWADANDKMAPFNQLFYIILNVAVGGSYFPDDSQNPGGKPWQDSEGANGVNSFWNGRDQWLPTWDVGQDQHLQVDYVKVWAV